MSEFKKGDIVRYSGGSSALVMLDSEHAGGWHGIHCLGGYRFVCDSWPSKMYPATEDDIATYNRLRSETLARQGRT